MKFARACLAGGVILAPLSSAAAVEPPASSDTVRVEVPDLDTVRYRDPSARRVVWLGAEVGGMILPASAGRFDRTVWTAQASPAWAVSLAPWLAVGGRHSVILYDASNIRLREHDHQVEISASTLALRSGSRRLRDRVAFGFSTHAIKKSTVDGLEIKPGGLNDTILHLSYGMSHDVARRWRLGWQTQLRHAWVFSATQRQVRAALRATVFVGQGHRLGAEAIGFYVNRDEDQGGRPLPRNGVYAQLAADWVWMSRAGVGPIARARFLSSFRSGEAPAYEIREESLNNVYGEFIVGVRGIWR